MGSLSNWRMRCLVTWMDWMDNVLIPNTFYYVQTVSIVFPVGVVMAGLGLLGRCAGGACESPGAGVSGR